MYNFTRFPYFIFLFLFLSSPGQVQTTHITLLMVENGSFIGISMISCEADNFFMFDY